MCVFIHSGTVKADPYVLKPMKELINSVNDLSNELILFDEFTSENIYEFLLNDLYEGEIDINELTIYSYGKNESPYLTYYGMVNVIKDCPDKFLYYNNGIKILCKNIIKSKEYSANCLVGKFKLESANIVNGAQTTGTLGKLLKEYYENLEKTKVFIQIIQKLERNI